jgi:predicted Zn-dependent protease
MKITIQRLLPLVILLPLVSACITKNPATGEQNFTPFMSPEKERIVGAEEHPKMVKQFGGVYDDPKIGGYVASIGGRLASHSERADLKFRFTVLNSPVVNAFALPGGYVYISRGLLALANSEAELASVLGHEIGHVTARHSAQRYNKSIMLGLGTAILGAATGNRSVGQLAEMGSAVYLKSHSRDQEHEADELGIRYLARTGYNTLDSVSFLRSLQAESSLSQTIAGKQGKDPAANIFSTHPRTADRVQRTASKTALANPGAPGLRSRLLDKIDGMIYGDDPSQGLIRGRIFFHPDLGFTFSVPQGFRLINSPRAVLAENKSGAKIIFDSDGKPWSGNLSGYLIRNWGKKLRLNNVEPISINGMQAATGSTRVKGRNGALDLRLVVIRFDQKTIARFLFVSPVNQTASLSEDFRRTTYRFRKLAPDERDEIKPLRVRIITVGSKDTVENLAAQMPFDDFRIARFRVLNGLRSTDRLKTGQRIKTVSE